MAKLLHLQESVSYEILKSKEKMPLYSRSTVVAFTDRPVLVKNTSHTLTIPFRNDCNPDAILLQLQPGDFETRKSLSLHLENLQGTAVLPPLDIYLNLERESKPEEKNYVGSMGLYGLSESFAAPGVPNGSGQDRIFDVSKVFERVRQQRNWSDKQFTLTLLPYNPMPVDATLQIGRIALYFYEW